MDTQTSLRGEARRAAYQAKYIKLNDTINATIFDGRFSMVPVYLDIEDELLRELAEHLRIPPDDLGATLGQTVSDTLNWTSGNPYVWHVDSLKSWKQQGRVTAPPFTALLCTFALAAEHMREDDDYSSHNYYERLFEVLGIENEDVHARTALRLHAKSTRPFWLALNAWLTENDFERGRPTARQINHWEYVSYAISQALVRQTDRERFHLMFSLFGLSPKEKLTRIEMVCYLEQWIPGGSASQWLKKLWSVPDLKKRVAAAACAELEVWDGAQRSHAAGAASSALSLAASFSAFPKQQLRLFLSAGSGSQEKPNQVTLTPDAGDAAQQAFSGATSGLWLTPLPSEGFSVLEPVTEFSISPLMLASFELQDPAAGRSLKRIARSVIPLARLDSSIFFREVSRISLLRQHMVLCHSQWVPRVRALLNMCARQGFRVITGGSIPGLPSDWTLFRDVELTRIPLETASNLQMLVPLADDAALELTGGLKLAQNIWHSACPPEAVGSCGNGPVSLQVTEQNLDKDPVVIAEQASKDNSVALRFSTLSLRDGTAVNVTLAQRGKKRAESAVVLRSANMPRRLAVVKAAGAAYVLNSANGRSGDTVAALSGLSLDGIPVRGMICDAPEAAPEPPEAFSSLENLNMPSLAATADDPGTEPNYLQIEAKGLKEICILKGHHVWKCESFEKGDEPKEAKWMVCRHCANSVLTRNRGAQRSGWSVNSGPRGKTPLPPQMPKRTHQSAKPDLLFDSLCYLGGGSWDRLRDLSASASEDTWFGPRFISALADLGHLDIALRAGSMHEESWVCPPPAVSFVAPGTAFLSGFRCETLTDAIRLAAEAAGGRLTPMEQENGPAALLVTGCTMEQLGSTLASVRDPHVRSVKVQRTPADKIAAAHPSIHALAAAMPQIHIGDFQGLERFELAKGTWRASAGIESLAAYRTTFGGRRYFFCTAPNDLHEGSFALVKLLAARSANLKLHAYDPGTRTFASVIGCEPPGLLRRALVSCSGLLPMRQGGVVNYRNVGPGTAATIMHKLYN